MHICKFIVQEVIDMEDGNRNSLMVCQSGDNAVMLSGVVIDISNNPANVGDDLYPTPTVMPVNPILDDPTPTDPPVDPTPDPTPDPVPADPSDPSVPDPSDPTTV